MKRTEFTELLDRLQQAQTHNAKLTRKLGRCAWHRNDARKEIVRLTNEYAPLEEERDTLRAQLEEAEQQIDDLRERLQRARNALTKQVGSERAIEMVDGE